MLRKDVYPYEYMDDRKNFSETLAKKEKLYSNLNMKISLLNIMVMKKKFGKNSEQKVQVNIKICMFKVVHFYKLSYLKPFIAGALKYISLTLIISFQRQDQYDKQHKKTKLELELLTGIDMLFMIKKGIKGGTCHALHQYAATNNKYKKHYDKNKDLPYLICWDVNNLCGWAMTQNLPVGCFEWVKNTSQSNTKLRENAKNVDE